MNKRRHVQIDRSSQFPFRSGEGFFGGRNAKHEDEAHIEKSEQTISYSDEVKK